MITMHLMRAGMAKGKISTGGATFVAVSNVETRALAYSSSPGVKVRLVGSNPTTEEREEQAFDEALDQAAATLDDMAERALMARKAGATRQATR